MLLKISRSQRRGLTGKVIFALDIRADYSQEERDNINKYNLGGEVVYSSEAAKARAARAQEGGLGSALWNIALANMNLNVSIASLSKGHHIECKNLNELLECEHPQAALYPTTILRARLPGQAQRDVQADPRTDPLSAERHP